MARREIEDLPLAAAVTHLLEECRMILPGLQALLGFQLIAVFNTTFAERLSATEQRIHLLALALLAVASALVMAPAAFHRQRRPRQASEDLLFVGSRLLLIAMVPLMLGIALDFYLIARLILGHVLVSALLAGVLVTLFAGLWFGFPRWYRNGT
jgi:uncharacterized protein DUF6328